MQGLRCPQYAGPALPAPLPSAAYALMRRPCCRPYIIQLPQGLPHASRQSAHRGGTGGRGHKSRREQQATAGRGQGGVQARLHPARQPGGQQQCSHSERDCVLYSNSDKQWLAQWPLLSSALYKIGEQAHAAAALVEERSSGPGQGGCAGGGGVSPNPNPPLARVKEAVR
jgi:hypothetical protein